MIRDAVRRQLLGCGWDDESFGRSNWLGLKFCGYQFIISFDVDGVHVYRDRHRVAKIPFSDPDFFARIDGVVEEVSL